MQIQLKSSFEQLSFTGRYAFVGVLCGMVFPVIATLADCHFTHSAISFAHILSVQKNQPLHWIIDTAPLILGLVASLAGRHYNRLREISVSRDELAAEVRQRKETETRLLAATQKAESANKAKSEFLANMSHELRTPMNGVLGMTHLLLKSGLNKEQREFADTIMRSGNSLLTVLNDILDFSKIEAGKLEFENIPFDLRKTVLDVKKLLHHKAHEKGLKLLLQYPDDSLRFVKGDPGRLQQVLTNLTGNAIKFTDKGHVRIDVETAVQDARHTRIKIDIEDTGIGIDEDKLEHIFEKFTQADSGTTRQYGGTGLGLAISKQLVELMGGTLGVKSTVAVGSVLSIGLTLARAHAEELKALEPRCTELDDVKSESATATEQLPVLLVDDDVINRKVGEKMLEILGCRVDLATNGREAVEMIRNNRYGIVLMDCQMPVMDGLTATGEIRALTEPHCSVVIVAMTANAMSGDRDKCLEAGMNDYLSKPVDSDELARVVNRWRRAESLFSE